MVSDDFPYKDILYNKNPKSTKHPPLSIEQRAAQFSPFAALVGFDDEVAETARRTDRRIDLSESDIEELNRKLGYIKENIEKEFEVKITYFVPDKRKSGGAYLDKVGVISKIREFECDIVMSDGFVIPINEVFKIEGEDLYLLED